MPGLEGEFYKYPQTYLVILLLSGYKLFSGYLGCFCICWKNQKLAKSVVQKMEWPSVSFESRNRIKATEVVESMWIQDQLFGFLMNPIFVCTCEMTPWWLPCLRWRKHVIMCSYHAHALLSSIHLFTFDISSIRNTDYQIFYGGNI